MRLIVCNSGSDGNTYLLNSNTDCVVLDCGVDLKTVKRTLNFKINHIKFVLCTHKHIDHSKHIKEYLKMGIKVFMPEQVKEEYENYSCAISVQPMKKICCGKFTITPFEVPHDEGVDCYAYIIEHNDLGKLLYMTDCRYCKYNLNKMKINHFLCECNYQQELVSRDLPNYEHKIRGHCSLDTCKKFIEINKSEKLKTVLLLHMGAETCNPMECVEEVQEIVGDNVYVNYARKGLEVELKENGCPF